MGSNPDAERYWQERVTSGEIDQNKELREIPENAVQATITFTGEELIIIEDALHRRFLQVKKGRFEVLSSVARVRRAMRKAMMSG